MFVPKQWIAPVLVALLLPVQPVSASQWRSVAAADGRGVEIDTRRIDRLNGDRVAAWTRLTFDAPALDFEHRLRYTAVEALNHYDCAGGRFATQQRVFLLDGRAVRSETVTAPLGMEVRLDSLDARLFDAACGDGSAAAYWASAAASRPRPMHAEMVSDGEIDAPRGIKVADAAPGAGKPRFIDMPVIDKSKAEDPFKNAPPAAQAPTAQSPAMPTTPSARQPVPQAPRAAPPPPPVPLALPDLSRQERERLLATSGPRRTAAPRKAPDPTPPAPDYSRVHWGYTGLGAPENWAKLRPDFALCGAGKRQSPIDIRGGIRVDLEPIKFDYRESHFRIVDSGHTVQVEVGEGSGITVMGRYWPLQRIEFRRPGEGRIDGRGHEMSLHLVHRDFDGSTAIVAVMLERGAEHPVIQTLWNHMPLEVGMEILPRDVTIEPARLLPERREYFTYMGSLTTPPCTENVLWMVLKAPVQVSPAQIAIFARLYPNNARPLQPVNNRLIKGSR